MTLQDDPPASLDSVPDPIATVAEVPEWRNAMEAVGHLDAAAVMENMLQQVDAREQAAKQVAALLGKEALEDLRSLILYFKGDQLDSNHQKWPHQGLRVLAMAATPRAAAGILGQGEVALDLAIRSRPPFKPWSWWFQLGTALRTDVPTHRIKAALGLSTKAVANYRRFLLGPVAERATKEAA